jgi:Carboxypeptidase regulatory-like domain
MECLVWFVTKTPTLNARRRSRVLMAPAARSLVLLLLLGAILAGCASPADDGPQLPSEEQREQDQLTEAGDAARQVDVKATKTTGIIRGVVVDDAIRPVAGALVTLTAGPTEGSTVTGTDGTFGFSELAPGAYFVTTLKKGFNDLQVAVEVTAGEDAPPVTRILLNPDLSYVAPYHVVQEFKGHIDCTSSAGNLCVGEYLVCDTSGVCPNVTDTDSFGSFYIPARPAFVQAEMFWEPSAETNQHLGISIAGRLDCDGNANNDTGRDASSPAYVSLDSNELGNSSTETGCEIGFSIHGGTQPGVPCYSPPAVLGEQCAGITVNQDYQVILHAFYGYTPPPGWRFSTEESVPSPPE